MIEKKKQKDIEKLLITKRLDDFILEDCRSSKLFIEKFGSVPSRAALLSLAKVISEHMNIYLDREAYRRKKVLMKWYDENYEKIKPFILENIKIEVSDIHNETTSNFPE